MDLLALQEKYDAFRITEDRETDSMIVERNIQYENRGKKLSTASTATIREHSS